MDDPIQTATRKPSLEQLDRLATDFVSCGTADSIWGTVKDADDIRFCRWEGQSADGRKRAHGDKPAFPWEGASDTRPMAVDDTINDLVCLCTTAFWRAIAGGRAADDATSGYAVALLDYFLNDRLADVLVDEVELSAQYMQHYGWVVLNVVWEQKTTLRALTVTMDELARMGQGLAQSDPTNWAHLANVPALLVDPAQADVAAAALSQMFGLWLATQEGAGAAPVPPESEFRRAVQDLRRTGEARVAVPYQSKNEPALYALKPWTEVLLPADTTDLQASRVVFQREYLAEADLRARVLDEGYDAEWVTEALRYKGPRVRWSKSSQVAPATGETKEDLVEVVHAVYKATDANGVPGVYCTTFHPMVKTRPGGSDALVARHELVDYAHGEYPYVLGKREHLVRQAVASRGVAEVARTWQMEEKALRDGIVDWTQIGVIPPVNVYQDPKQLKYKFGPAVQNFVRLGREPSFMPIPNSGVPGAIAALDGMHIRRSAYFGTAHPQVPPEVSQVRSTRTIQRFLAMWVRAFRQTLALAQQYMPDAEFASVTGAPPGWLDARRKMPALLTASLSFDTRELNEELMLKRLEVMNRMVLPSDSQGTIQRAKWTEIQVRAVNPAWAKELVQPVSEGSQALFEQVRNDIAQMFLGNAPQMVENDPMAGGKLAYAQQIVQANPNYMKALQEQGRFAELMQAYAKNLGFSQTQEQNKQIGRIGVTPPQ